MKRKRPLKPKFEAARDDVAQAPENHNIKKGGSYRDLTEKVGPVFNHARDWAAEQRQKLSDEQRRHFDELKKEREKEEKKKLKAIEATQQRIARETEKRTRLKLELRPPYRHPNLKTLRLGTQLKYQRTELKKYQEERREIETRFLKRHEGISVPDKGANESVKKPEVRRERRRLTRGRDAEDRPR